LKTRQAAAKRFIKTGLGKLKYGHAGKAHLNSHMSRSRIMRLNKKVRTTMFMFRLHVFNGCVSVWITAYR
jgi:ribosomal protein L35